MYSVQIIIAHVMIRNCYVRNYTSIANALALHSGARMPFTYLDCYV